MTSNIYTTYLIYTTSSIVVWLEILSNITLNFILKFSNRIIASEQPSLFTLAFMTKLMLQSNAISVIFTQHYLAVSGFVNNQSPCNNISLILDNLFSIRLARINIAEISRMENILIGEIAKK